jgi:membrane-associated phospholipid phosphatase
LGTGWFIADRVDLPFVDEPGVNGVVLDIAAYPIKRWSPSWSAALLLQEFASLPWSGTVACPAPAAPGTLGGEIKDLIRAAEDERADAMGEILGQSQEFVTDFVAALGIAPNSYPATTRLLYAAEAIGAMVAMHFKEIHKRPRPSHKCPALLPPIPVPGHPSYPSGHATQAHLMALFARDAMPAAVKAGMETVLIGLADRIARNREIAGMHYRSDSVAGKTLATNTYNYFNANSLDTGLDLTAGLPRSFGDAVRAAQAEWQ